MARNSSAERFDVPIPHHEIRDRERMRVFMIRAILMCCLCILVFPSIGRTKTSQPERSTALGSYTNGCLKHGVPLPPEGVGYQTVRSSRKRVFGHHSLIRYIKALAKKSRPFWKKPSKEEHALVSSVLETHISSKSNWVLAIADLSSQAGGPTIGNHNSHQNGLDVDVWFSPIPSSLSQEQKERFSSSSMVSEDGTSIGPAFTRKHVLLLQAAATFPMVDRIFVHPTIKQALCHMNFADRSWIKKIRPWHGHRSHFHVRLTCPKDSPLCKKQAPLPVHDGCGAELTAWLHPVPAEKTTPENPNAIPPKKQSPAACEQFWEASGIRPEKRWNSVREEKATQTD